MRRPREAPSAARSGRLAQTPGRASQQQVGDVCARNQEHETDSPEEKKKGPANLADIVGLQRINRQAQAVDVLVSVPIVDLRGDGVRLRLRARGCCFPAASGQ